MNLLQCLILAHCEFQCCLNFLNFNTRFCVYPQEVVLRLTEPATLKKLQILSHQYLVGKFDHAIFEIRNSSCTFN